ncbi:hypothetical protein FRC20_003887 [Serendipita sp. 405]|nr:hypothetical protein FRC20_003887 [Serendipita sp. 405]
MTLGSSMESQFTRNVRIRKGVKAKVCNLLRMNGADTLQRQVAAHPVLEPLALVEYEFQGEYITAVHCPRLSTDNTRVFRHGKWTHDAEEIGPLGKSFEVAWQGSNSHSIAEKTYKEIQTSLEQRIRSWLKKPPSSGNFTPLNDALWASSLVGQEAAYAIRPWRASKLELWKKGYELAG